jgi:AbrB family looped-hinge helix DNA binding protein
MEPIVLQVRSNGQITLPTSVRRQAHLREGDILEVVVEEDGSLRLVPKMAIDRSQVYFWTKRWQLAEREVEDDLQAGRYQDFNSMDDLIQSLQEDMQASGEANDLPTD